MIGLIGKKKSGKDTFYKFVSEAVSGAQGSQRFAFGDILKAEVAEKCGVTVEFINAHKDLYRKMLQWWGTDYRRNPVNPGCYPEYWIHRLIKSDAWRDRSTTKLTAVTDIRFLNEAQLIRSLGGVLIRIERKETDEEDAHISESEMEKIKVDYTIQNSGSLAMFQAITNGILPDILKRIGTKG